MWFVPLGGRSVNFGSATARNRRLTCAASRDPAVVQIALLAIQRLGLLWHEAARTFCAGDASRSAENVRAFCNCVLCTRLFAASFLSWSALYFRFAALLFILFNSHYLPSGFPPRWSFLSTMCGHDGYHRPQFDEPCAQHRPSYIAAVGLWSGQVPSPMALLERYHSMKNGDSTSVNPTKHLIT
ncbi:hypothetical protein OBBRIDRAFT_570483 [Obba rivulosa]|uniref:Uncharacterized protein n=1 Tax=Obba rivulosa TaxID=1052685 RepID=A0A8E2B3M9_9APHY|nr:hypothetical protein OBBRIDRAFT_570483 [Obba rivulosa]